MHGYVNNIDRVFNEWHQLFKKKHHIPSAEINKRWKYITNSQLTSFKNNYWKSKSSFEEFLKYNFIINNNIELDALQCHELSLPIDCNRLVFINGKFSYELSDTVISPWIIKTYQISYLYKISTPIQPTIFLFFTECLSDNIVSIKLPKESITQKPLYLLHIGVGSNIYNQLITSNYCCHLEIEKNARACVIEHFISINEHKHFIGNRMLIYAGEYSTLDYTKLVFENNSSYHISHQDINLKKSAVVNNNTFIITGPKFTYHQINSKINQKQSYLTLNSLSFLDKKDVGSIKTYIEHNNKNYSSSKQLHKIIANDYSTGIFDGLIKVNINSIHTDSKMINNNLLLKKSASIYSTPKLEIYSDLVQCSHGSTIGFIDLHHIFYLNTRGISTADAIKILTYAFTSEITETVKNTNFKKIIKNKIQQAFRKIT